MGYFCLQSQNYINIYTTSRARNGRFIINGLFQATKGAIYRKNRFCNIINILRRGLQMGDLFYTRER